MALAVAAIGGGCKTAYDVEDRETPVHVILEAPEAARAAVTVLVLVYVGDHKAVDRTVSFAAGSTRLELPTLYLRAGTPTVSVVLQGRAVATDTVKVRQPTWILITIASGGAKISSANQDPSGAR